MTSHERVTVEICVFCRISGHFKRPSSIVVLANMLELRLSNLLGKHSQYKILLDVKRYKGCSKISCAFLTTVSKVALCMYNFNKLE